MAPKLYIIESKERDGLVKIGVTEREDDESPHGPVYKRISEYRTGLSDESIVHETSGAKVFEKYLHNFFQDNHKSIIIKLKDGIFRPDEWFTLEPHALKALVDTFSKEHPGCIEDVHTDELPIFLSGAMSAIQWHARRSNDLQLLQEQFAEEYNDHIRATQNSLSDLYSTDYNAQLLHPKTSDPSGEFTPRIDADFNSLFNEAGQVPILKAQLEQRNQLREGRTAIAVAAIILIIFLMFTGAFVASTIFALLSLITLAAWPWIQPIVVPRTKYLLSKITSSSNAAANANNRQSDDMPNQQDQSNE